MDVNNSGQGAVSKLMHKDLLKFPLFLPAGLCHERFSDVTSRGSLQNWVQTFLWSLFCPRKQGSGTFWAHTRSQLNRNLRRRQKAGRKALILLQRSHVYSTATRGSAIITKKLSWRLCQCLLDALLRCFLRKLCRKSRCSRSDIQPLRRISGGSPEFTACLKAAV